MYFEFSTPGKIISGTYALENIATELKLLGCNRVMILSNKVLEEIKAVKTLSDAIITGGIKVVGTYTSIPADSDILVVNYRRPKGLQLPV